MNKISLVLLLILLLGYPIKAQEINDVVKNLYFYRPGIENSINSISKISPDLFFSNLQNINPRSLNYIGYYFLTERDKRAIPTLIEFMNPDYKKDNESDANYNFTWTMLQMIITDQFVVLSKDENTWYSEFKKWWQENGKNFNLALEDSALKSILQEIKNNEDKLYRKSW